MGKELPPAADPHAPDLSMALSFSLDFWWLYLWFLGLVSRSSLVLIVAGLTGLMLSLWRAHRLAIAVPRA